MVVVKKCLAIAAVSILLVTILCVPKIRVSFGTAYPFTAAVIICGWDEQLPELPFFWADSYFAYWMMIHHYSISPDFVAYLCPTMNPDIRFPAGVIDAVATKENVRSYLGTWLREKDANSVFVYMTSHGGGFNMTTGDLENGRWDESGDEGNEHYVNGTWGGVDECTLLWAGGSSYWDDEMREDLNWTLTESISTIMIQNCYVPETSNMTCFSGGFIDDMSHKYGRTVIASSNETGISLGMHEHDSVGVFSPFTYHFFTSILGYEVVWAGSGGIYVDYNRPVSWQYNQSLRGAFEYTLQHDVAYMHGHEFPWFDDDGDRLPTYVNGGETPDFPWNSLDLMRWLQHDINYDGIVNMLDVAIVGRAYGSGVTSPLWNRQADVFPVESWYVDMADVGYVSRDFGKQT